MSIRFGAAVLLLAAGAVGLTAQEGGQEERFLSRVEAALALKPGAVVADIGTGVVPQFPLRLAKAVGDGGQVICVDISAKALEVLRGKLDAGGGAGVRTQLGKADDPMLPDGGVDAVLIAYAYHEMTEYAAMLRHIREALRPDGRLVVIEGISEKNRDAARERQVENHELSPEYVERELRAAGFELVNGVERLVETDGVLRYLAAARPKAR
jgi:ubiquinone/menaquinone biosynthesis C-methylase UbiE